MEKSLGSKILIKDPGKKAWKGGREAIGLLFLLGTIKMPFKGFEYAINVSFLQSGHNYEKKVWRWHLWEFKSKYPNRPLDLLYLEFLEL